MNPCLPVIAAVGLLGLVSCASLKAGAAEDYDQGQASRPQFLKDADVCAKLAEGDQKKFGMGGELDPTHSTYNRMFDACMRASGYRRKQVP